MGFLGKLAKISSLGAVFMPGWMVHLLNPRRDTYRGTVIDPKAFAVGRLASQIRDSSVLPTVAESRVQMQKLVDRLDRKGPAIAQTNDMMIDGADGPVRARLYSDRPNSRHPGPAMVFYHGGGFMQGDLESHHQTCRKFAKWWGGVIISVDYRLAPEHVFPAGVDDAIAAFRWVAANAATLNINPAQIGVCGDSAGGSFAAVVAQQMRSNGGPVPRFQVLIYPVTDGNLNSRSLDELTDAYVLPKNRMQWYRDLYAGDLKDFSDPKFSPLLAKDFAGLPDSYIVTGGFDPLADDGANFAAKLQDAGVNVTHRHFAGQVHAFVNLTKVIPQGTQALQEISDWLRTTCPPQN